MSPSVPFRGIHRSPIVAAVEGVGGCQDGGPSIEGCGDARLGDAHGLLLHDFVDRRAIRFIHFVELVDAAHALVGQHQCSSLESHVSRRDVFRNGCGKTDARGTLSGCVHSARRNRGDVFQKLGFCNSGIAHKTNVDVAADSHAVWELHRAKRGAFLMEQGGGERAKRIEWVSSVVDFCRLTLRRNSKKGESLDRPQLQRMEVLDAHI